MCDEAGIVLRGRTIQRCWSAFVGASRSVDVVERSVGEVHKFAEIWSGKELPEDVRRLEAILSARVPKPLELYHLVRFRDARSAREVSCETEARRAKNRKNEMTSI